MTKLLVTLKYVWLKHKYLTQGAIQSTIYFFVFFKSCSKNPFTIRLLGMVVQTRHLSPVTCNLPWQYWCLPPDCPGNTDVYTPTALAILSPITCHTGLDSIPIIQVSILVNAPKKGIQLKLNTYNTHMGQTGRRSRKETRFFGLLASCLGWPIYIYNPIQHSLISSATLVEMPV